MLLNQVALCVDSRIRLVGGFRGLDVSLLHPFLMKYDWPEVCILRGMVLQAKFGRAWFLRKRELPSWFMIKGKVVEAKYPSEC